MRPQYTNCDALNLTKDNINYNQLNILTPTPMKVIFNVVNRKIVLKSSVGCPHVTSSNWGQYKPQTVSSAHRLIGKTVFETSYMYG